MKNQTLKRSLLLIFWGVIAFKPLFAESGNIQPDQKDETATQSPNITTLDSEPLLNSDWNPFEEMDRMQQHMSHFFNQSMKRLSEMSRDSLFYQPDVDIQEKTDKYIVRMDLPGMQKDQIKIDATEDSLSISGERKVQSEEENVRDGYYRMERNFGAFHRTIPLEQKIKTEEVTAKYEDGVLEIDLPKVDSKAPAAKSIKIQ